MLNIQYLIKNKILARVISVSFFGFLLGCNQVQFKTNHLAVTVERIVSGQTIEVVMEDNNQPQTVRIVGIDVPPSDNWKRAAKTGLQNFIQEGQVYLELEVIERDRYDRILAHVWHDRALVSEELAKQGYVLANTKYSNQYSDRIFHAQEFARILGYGIWSVEDLTNQ